MPNLIKMQRNDKLADVHPDMIKDYQKVGWTHCNTVAQAKPAKPEETQADEVTLADLVDDRALKYLAEVDIFTVEDFRAADPEFLIKNVKYVTANTIKKVN